MKNKIKDSVNDCIAATQQLQSEHNILFIENVARTIADTFQSGGKVIIAGNGGSLCDASHFAEELTGFYRGMRRALPAISLSEPGHITCTANDLGFDYIFSRGVEAYGKPGDLFVGLTTSGNSQNIINAVDVAKLNGLKVVTFLGKGGGSLKGMADFEMIIDRFATSDRIQEAHMAAIHIIIEIVEEHLFNSPSVVEFTCAER